MIRPIPPIPAENPEVAFFPALKNPAVALCNGVWVKIHAATLMQTSNVYAAERCASKAFRLAMPSLSGYRNISDFIACAGFGILVGAIQDKNGAKLLAAARIALSAIPGESRI